MLVPKPENSKGPQTPIYKPQVSEATFISCILIPSAPWIGVWGKFILGGGGGGGVILLNGVWMLRLRWMVGSKAVDGGVLLL